MFIYHLDMKSKKWSELDLTEAVKSSISVSQVVIKLGLSMAGGSHSTIKNYIQKLNLDTSHFKGQGWNNQNYSKPLEEILVENSDHYDSYSLKKRLLKENILKNICSECGLENKWNNRPINLHLDHINGIKMDNRIQNLRILCPNCHSQTKTYAGRNRRKSSNTGGEI